MSVCAALRCSSLALALLHGCSLAAAQDQPASCAGTTWQAGGGLEASRWQEHDLQGQRLLREHGTLRTLALGRNGHCAGWHWQLDAGLAAGERAYVGRSSLGAAIQTSSRLERLQWQALALYPLTESWQAGARLGQRRLWRDLRSVGPVQGYAERFDSWHAALGLQHRFRPFGGATGAPTGQPADPASGADLGRAPPSVQDLVLDVALWLGAGPPGRLRLQLPQTDAALLRLGSSQLVALTLGLGPPPAVAGWRLAFAWQHERTGAGPTRALWRQGVQVGGAAQPATRQQALGLQAALAW